MFKWMGEKILTILPPKFLLIWRPATLKNVQHSNIISSPGYSHKFLESATSFGDGLSSRKGDSYVDIGAHVHTKFWSPYISSMRPTDGQNLLEGVI